ncbi:3'-5' exonuclease [Micromonospora echinaurantiaca]|uniref:3'-5' exonuclease n=1 Tax=Micromonospora echinaurantiaca TaxID=47857 RepID=UPI003796B737
MTDAMERPAQPGRRRWIVPGHVWTHGLGEQRRYAIQHTLRHQIWELERSHYLHAHGRSLNGTPPTQSRSWRWPASANSSSRRRGMKTTSAKYGKLTPMGSQLWHGTEIVALDLEGSGAQDRDTKAILEVAVVPLAHGQPDLDQAFTSLVNPGRPIPQRPWISPGLTNAVLAEAPALEQIAPRFGRAGRWPMGAGAQHQRGLAAAEQHLPALRPAGLLDSGRRRASYGASRPTWLVRLTHARTTPACLPARGVADQLRGR